VVKDEVETETRSKYVLDDKELQRMLGVLAKFCMENAHAIYLILT